MVVNFRDRRISRGERKLGQIATLIIKKNQNSNMNNTGKKKKKKNRKNDNKWTMSNLSQILKLHSGVYPGQGPRSWVDH